MKRIASLLLVFTLAQAPVAHADMFGGDVAVLMQILANALEQLAQLQSIFQNGKDSLDFLKDINRGINDSLSMVRTVYPNIDPGVYKDWNSVQSAIQKIESIYGAVPQSPSQQVYQDSDQGIAEAVKMNNSVYDYTNQIDQIGEEIKAASHAVSPGGAQKLTAESMGVMLHVMNQGLRVQATGLKLQAQNIAIQNKKDKDSTREYLAESAVVQNAMDTENVDYALPRF